MPQEKKCAVCGAASEIKSDGKAYCLRHYVETECEECLHWDAVSISGRIKEKRATPHDGKLLAEILKKYPHTLHHENEFGEHVSDEELSAITERFRKLAPQQIDAVFHRCGYVFADHAKEYKALRKSDIHAIMGDFDKAKGKIWSLLCESHIDEVKKALDGQEKRGGPSAGI